MEEQNTACTLSHADETEHKQTKKERKATKDAMGSRMKEYEAATQSYLQPNQPIMMRLDGHTFSKFTRGFKKPYDPRLHEAMVQTTCDLLGYFNNCVTGYTQSDEITLVFPSTTLDTLFNGKVQKITTLAASYCSVRFNHNLTMQEFDKEKEASLYEKVHSFRAHFDARVFNVPNDGEILNNVMWRSNYDARRNSKMALAFAHFSASALHGLTSNQAMEKLEKEKGLRWEDQPSWFRFGSFVKREQYDLEAVNPKTQETTVAKRTRVVPKSFELSVFSEANIQLMTSKYWPEVASNEVPKTE